MDYVWSTIQILSALLTLAIGGITVYIAWQQHKTARNKIKLDLYDRRYKVYRGVMDLLTAIVRNNGPSRENLGNYFRTTDEKRFLFGDDVCDYLREFRERAGQLQRVRELGEDRESHSQSHIGSANQTTFELISWFENQDEEVISKFKKYLDFKRNL
jgi:hypothetical protein